MPEARVKQQSRYLAHPAFRVVEFRHHCACLPALSGERLFEPLFHHTMRKQEEKTVMPSGEQPLPNFDFPELPANSVDRQALDNLFTTAYEELRRLAATVRRGDPSATLSPTVLVNEAWLKLAKSPEVGATSRLHFIRIAARAMRQLLVEAARRRNANKRGAGAEITVIFDDAVRERPSCGEEILALNKALDTLAKMSPRQAIMIESRFFGGLDIPETAALLNVSEATVLRDWRAAKAWLANELRETS